MALDFMRFKVGRGIIRVIILIIIVIIISMVSSVRRSMMIMKVIVMRSARGPGTEIGFGGWFGMEKVFFFIVQWLRTRSGMVMMNFNLGWRWRGGNGGWVWFLGSHWEM